MREADSQVLQAKVEDLERAYRNFFAQRSRFPRFKRKDGPQSIRYPQRFRFTTDRIYLPKVGWVKAIFHRVMEGTPKNVTVSRTTSGDYYVSAQCEREIEPGPHPGPIVGVDVGLTHLAILSTGEKVKHPRHLRRAEKRLARLQRSLARKRRGSQNRARARRMVARQYAYVTNARRDTLHKLSHHLARDFGTIRLESLNVRGMLKNQRLAKSIADSGWNMLVEMCRYKATWRGGTVEHIDRFYPSSKTCHVCGAKNETLTLAEREWTCAECGTTHDRDINAAQRGPLWGAHPHLWREPPKGKAWGDCVRRYSEQGRRTGRGTTKPKRSRLGSSPSTYAGNHTMFAAYAPVVARWCPLRGVSTQL